MGKRSPILASGIILALASFAVAQDITSTVCEILLNIQWLLYMIAAGIGIVVMTFQGIKWIGSAEDPGARKQAKQGIVGVIIGLIIVLLAIWIVGLVFTTGTSC